MEKDKEFQWVSDSNKTDKYQGVAAPKEDAWYTENEMYQWLITQKYSEEIAKELSAKWAADLQWSFNKGFKKGSDFINKSELATLRQHLKEREEALKELLNIIDKLYPYPSLNLDDDRLKAIIERSRKLISK